MAAFIPEPDDNCGARHLPARIDPRDFEEDKPRRRRPGRKAQEYCHKGHPYVVDGSVEKAGGNRCKVCMAEGKRRRYHARKEKAA
jgi:hypothetical protein